MSITFSLHCKRCGASLWIGQQGAGSEVPWIYRLPEHLVALERFLNQHVGHELVYAADLDESGRLDAALKADVCDHRYVVHPDSTDAVPRCVICGKRKEVNR